MLKAVIDLTIANVYQNTLASNHSLEASKSFASYFDVPSFQE